MRVLFAFSDEQNRHRIYKIIIWYSYVTRSSISASVEISYKLFYATMLQKRRHSSSYVRGQMACKNKKLLHILNPEIHLCNLMQKLSVGIFLSFLTNSHRFHLPEPFVQPVEIRWCWIVIALVRKIWAMKKVNPVLYYSRERILMLRCWSAIPLANREGSGSKSAGPPVEDVLVNFGLNHLLSVRPLILIFPWDSSPWYLIPNLLSRAPTVWPTL